MYGMVFSRLIVILLRPERWENVPSAASGIPTVWANLFTFGAGPTNCTYSCSCDFTHCDPHRHRVPLFPRRVRPIPAVFCVFSPSTDRFFARRIKALLFTLLRAFEFEPAVPKGGIGPTASPLQGPIVLTEPEKGTQLPLILKPYNAQV
jgi:hypothetical protein